MSRCNPTDSHVHLVVAITALVARHFGVTVTELLGRGRPWRLVLPRFIAWTLLHDAGLSPALIGRFFHHAQSTVYYGLKQLQEDVETCQTVRVVYDAIRADYASHLSHPSHSIAT